VPCAYHAATLYLFSFFSAFRIPTSDFRIPTSDFKLLSQLNRLNLSPAGIAGCIVDLSSTQIHDNGQAGDDLPQRLHGRVAVGTDGKWLVHVIFENILDTLDIDFAL
jgi:hypothetical protein